MPEMKSNGLYRGRLAPTPSGYLHLGHAQTFWIAQKRALSAGGELILRNEDLDSDRCRPQFVDAMIEDLSWFGFKWDEGPDAGGFKGPYNQSERLDYYRHSWTILMEAGVIYPSPHSRKDVAKALTAPHEDGEKEPLFPTELRPKTMRRYSEPGNVNWRYRVPDGLEVAFQDQRTGEQRFTAGKDFGDFIIWRKDGFPSYELAVVTDDFAMAISEVVRGEDLLLSTARQLLLYKSLGWPSPAYFHCPLLKDETGRRMAKRHQSMSLHALREEGYKPVKLRGEFFDNRYV